MAINFRTDKTAWSADDCQILENYLWIFLTAFVVRIKKTFMHISYHQATVK